MDYLIFNHKLRINDALLEAFKIIRRENPEYDVKDIKLSPSIHSTQYPDGHKTIITNIKSIQYAK